MNFLAEVEESSGVFDHVLDPISCETLTGEAIMSFIVMGIIIILSIISYFIFRKKDPTKPEKGLAFVLVFLVEKMDGMVEDLMGKKWDGFGGYITGLAMYIGLSFLVGVMGFPGPMSSLSNTFSIGLCTFALIHATAARANKWGYFKRFIDPTPVLLPINLLSMWAPLLSISLRIFGNAISGFTLMSIIYWALGNVSTKIFSFIGGSLSSVILPPLITWVLHAYFDVFSGFIQTLIFIMLTMIQVSLEDPDPELA